MCLVYILLILANLDRGNRRLPRSVHVSEFPALALKVLFLAVPVAHDSGVRDIDTTTYEAFGPRKRNHTHKWQSFPTRCCLTMIPPWPPRAQRRDEREQDSKNAFEPEPNELRTGLFLMFVRLKETKH